MAHTHRSRAAFGTTFRLGLVASAVLASGCVGGSGAATPAVRTAPPPIDAGFTDASGRASLGADPEAALETKARGAPAGTLLARSGNGSTCVFANGRNGWNRAAC